MSSRKMSPREVLTWLHVKSTGRGTYKEVCHGLIMSLSEAPRDSGAPYVISVVFGSRRKDILLAKADMVTRGKGMWQRGNLWRLSEATIARFEPQIAALVARLAAGGV